jgi:hypothetical protein
VKFQEVLLNFTSNFVIKTAGRRNHGEVKAGRKMREYRKTEGKARV